MKKYYDAVIVGCGVAGCFAALHLPQEADILMITKADTEDSDSFLAQGGICVLKNEDDYDAFYEDTMHAGHYENTPESVDIMIRSSRNVINQLIAWDVDFRRDENGELCKYQLFPKPEKVDICLLKGHLLFYGTDYAVSLRDAASRSGTASSGHRM